MIQKAVIASPIGKLEIKTANEKLIGIGFLTPNAQLIKPADAFSKNVVAQLEKYFDNSQYCFKLAMQVLGTDFQQQVWQAMNNIPVGTVLSYGQLAKQLKTSPRAIGNACRTNPIPVIVPCHRIVASNHLGGFAGNMKGRMIAIKTWLLQHEFRHASPFA